MLKKSCICGTKVMRWERNWEQDKSFIKPENYPPESMTTVSTHDADTLTLWWKNHPQEARDYAVSKGWEFLPHLSQDHLFEILRESHHSSSLFHINLLNEYFPLVAGMSWPSPEDERINTPGVISDLNWTYRFRPSVEELTSSQAFARVIRQLLRP